MRSKTTSKVYAQRHVRHRSVAGAVAVINIADPIVGIICLKQIYDFCHSLVQCRNIACRTVAHATTVGIGATINSACGADRVCIGGEREADSARPNAVLNFDLMGTLQIY